MRASKQLHSRYCQVAAKAGCRKPKEIEVRITRNRIFSIALVVACLVVACAPGDKTALEGRARHAIESAAVPASPHGRQLQRVDEEHVPKQDRPRLGTAAENPVKSANLPAEIDMIRSGQLSRDRAVSLMSGEAFLEFMKTMSSQSRRDVESAELTEVYARQILSGVTDDRAISLASFACGISICAGRLIAYGPQGEAQYQRIHAALFSGEGAPAYSMIELPVSQGALPAEHRFIFSTEQGMNSIGAASGAQTHVNGGMGD
ncbi:hypothetical protein [Xanthomonas sacchari]|uniref:hypothetical protein n=1 Tax=Xanthomonas sacchari TaxID=56458 RepID=UPI0020C2EB0C|nr:hypothetical protein [Xanthomonas sacchari]